MKFDRIALKITFFILISGLVLMSNVAISQTPTVDSWTQSTEKSNPNYERLELNNRNHEDIRFEVTLEGTDLNLVNVKFTLTRNDGRTGKTTVGPAEINSGKTEAKYRVTAATGYETTVKYVPYIPGECHPDEKPPTPDADGRCTRTGIMNADPGWKFTLSATIDTTDQSVTIGEAVPSSYSWSFHAVSTTVVAPPEQPSEPPVQGPSPDNSADAVAPPVQPPVPPAQAPVQLPVPPNKAPVFTDGASTTRSIAENTGSGVSIGTAVAATDADSGDTLTYTLGGTDAAAFGIDSTTGQLRTSAALDYETKTSYSVIVTVSDGTLTDSITVTINVTNVNENNAPVFTDGASTTRSIAENTGSGVSIGTAVAATDADSGDTLTYTLGGTDAAAFGIDSTTGQLRTSAALDYETKTSYTVTVSVSDGNGGSDSITVTIHITDVAETVVPPPTPPSDGGTEQPSIPPVQPPAQPSEPPVQAPPSGGGTEPPPVQPPVQPSEPPVQAPPSGGGTEPPPVQPPVQPPEPPVQAPVQQPPTQPPAQQPDDASNGDTEPIVENTQNEEDTQEEEDTTQADIQPPGQPPTNNQGSGGGGGTLPKPVTPVNPTVEPFDYEREGVGKIVFSEWMLSTLNDMPQWIELYNTTDEDINLRGWRIVGRFMDGNDNIHMFKPHTINSLRVKAKQSHLIVAYSASVYRGSFSENLQDNVYSLQSTRPSWNGKAFVLELQDSRGTPIDRIGNLNEQDQVEWKIPSRTRHWGNSERRISLIRRLKSVESRKYNFRFGVAAFGWFPADEVEKLTEVKRSEYFYGRPSDIGTPGYRTEGADPLPVTLSYFLPQVSENGSVVLSWATASEIENAGFNVFRSESVVGAFRKINASLIQGAGTTSDRNEYTWIDTTAKPHVEYYYRIEDMSFDGISEVVATQRLKGVFTAKNRALTRWAILKKGTE